MRGLYSFNSVIYPSGLVQGTDGNFYGTTIFGGLGRGTVFKYTTIGGTLTTLYSFCSQSACSDGSGPCCQALVQGTDGNFYGTTETGGGNRGGGDCPQGCGTVFKITPEGTLTTLHSFDFTDGAQPEYALLQASDGNFYGTTFGGGAVGAGTIFRITPKGALTTLYNAGAAVGFPDGAYPTGLVQATNGKFYGTMVEGGTTGDGTVYSLSVGLGPFVEALPMVGPDGAAVEISGNKPDRRNQRHL